MLSFLEAFGEVTEKKNWSWEGEEGLPEAPRCHVLPQHLCRNRCGDWCLLSTPVVLRSAGSFPPELSQPVSVTRLYSTATAPKSHHLSQSRQDCDNDTQPEGLCPSLGNRAAPKAPGAEAKLCCCSRAQGNERPMGCWTSCIQASRVQKQQSWNKRCGCPKKHKPGEMRAQSPPLQPGSHRHRAGHKGSTAFNCSSLTQPGTRAWEAPASPIAVRPVKLTPCLENCI